MIFVDYLRPQIKYDNWDLLKVQIEKDVEAVRNAVQL
jgi:FAD synthase